MTEKFISRPKTPRTGNRCWAGKSFPPGTFGENFTSSGLLEDSVCIGDIWRVNEATLQVTMPRGPRFKFGYKVGRPTNLKEFLHSGRNGCYQRVLTEGFVQAGDAIELLEREPHAITVRQMLGLQKLGEGDAAALRRALEIESLPPLVRGDLTARLAGIA